MLNVDSSHKPKIRAPGDGPRKIKIIKGNISSKKIIRSDSVNKSQNMNGDASEHYKSNDAAKQALSKEKVVVKRDAINLSPEGKIKLLNSRQIQSN